MSTIQTVNGVKYFTFKNQLIRKTDKGYRTVTGEKFNGNKLSNFIMNKKGIENRQEVAHLKSICNRLCGTDYSFAIN
ncbi:MAG: hypothetical protein GY928_03920 [Colwellia sp.]|nr:hypothetical protein [Colwellia sp.]